MKEVWWVILLMQRAGLHVTDHQGRGGDLEAATVRCGALGRELLAMCAGWGRRLWRGDGWAGLWRKRRSRFWTLGPGWVRGYLTPLWKREVVYHTWSLWCTVFSLPAFVHVMGKVETEIHFFFLRQMLASFLTQRVTESQSIRARSHHTASPMPWFHRKPED